MSNTDVVPVITAAQAVQALNEAIQQLEREYPSLKEPLERARRNRTALMQWVDEQP